MTTARLGLDRSLPLAAVLAAAASGAVATVLTFALNEPRILVFAVTLALMIVASQARPQTVVRLILVLLAFQGFPAYFTGYFPTGTLFADDAVALVLTGRLVVSDRRERIRERTFGWLAPAAALLAAYVAVSIMLDSITPWPARFFAAWQIAYLWPVAAVAVRDLKSAVEVRRLLNFVWRLGWLQVLVVALEWPVLLAAGYFTAIPPVDLFAGTLGKGSAHILGIWMSMLIVLTVALWAHGVLALRQVVAAGVGFLFVLVSGSTRQMYVVAPFVIAGVVALSPMRVRARALLIVLVPVAMLGFFRAYSIATQMSFSVENLILKQQQRTRLAFYGYSWTVAKAQDALWFGTGVGSYASTSGLRYGSPLATEAARAFPHDVNMVSATEWPVLLVELGVVGLLCLVGVYAALSWRMLQISRRAQDPLARGLALGGLGAILILLGGALGSRAFEYQLPSLHVWLTCGLAAALYRLERRGDDSVGPDRLPWPGHARRAVAEPPAASPLA